MTTAHLPECPHSNSRTVTFYGGYCVCPLLRACEQRVEETWSAIAGRDQYAEGYVAALTAAREAVAGLQVYDDHGALKPFSPETAVVYMTAALAAIDALRNPPSLPPTTGRAHKY